MIVLTFETRWNHRRIFKILIETGAIFKHIVKPRRRLKFNKKVLYYSSIFHSESLAYICMVNVED